MEKLTDDSENIQMFQHRHKYDAKSERYTSQSLENIVHWRYPQKSESILLNNLKIT